MHAPQRDEWPGDRRPVGGLVWPDAKIDRIDWFLARLALARGFPMPRASASGQGANPGLNQVLWPPSTLARASILPGARKGTAF